MTRSRALQLALACGVFAALVSAGPDVSGQAPPAGQGAAPVPPVVLKGKLERLKVHGKALAGNLMKESDSPDVSIYLPPSYLTDRTRRFPVVYLLHGYTSTDVSYFGGNAQRLLHVSADRLFAAGTVRDMILVMPNCMNAYGGCMYASSPTTGDWESYVAEDLVAYQLMVARLKRFGVPHTFETYEGDHGSKVLQRLEERVLPFFARHLALK